MFVVFIEQSHAMQPTFIAVKSKKSNLDFQPMNPIIKL